MVIIFRKFAVRYRQPKTLLNRVRDGLHPTMRLFLSLLAAAMLAGCEAGDAGIADNAVLIRTDNRTVTKQQFERAFETARIAYSDNRQVEPQLMEQARLRMLNQMAEELIVERRAEELGVTVDDQTLEAAIRDIKKGYQEDEFEQMLLESAIPYALWKDRLRVRLLMEKVVDSDLTDSITISAHDIEAYYKAHESEFGVDEETPPEADLKHRIVERLRREKVEAAYPQWMEGLRERYQVKINWELWRSSTDPNTKTANQAGE